MNRIATIVSAAGIATALAAASTAAYAQSFAEVIVGEWSMAEACEGPSFAFRADGTATNPDGEQATYSVTDTSITIVDSDGVSDTAVVVFYSDTSFDLQVDDGTQTATLYRCDY